MIPEKRCPICLALYNIEPCRNDSHAKRDGVLEERSRNVRLLRRYASARDIDSREDIAVRDAFNEAAATLESDKT